MKVASKIIDAILLLLAIPTVLLMLLCFFLVHTGWFLFRSKRSRNGWLNGYGHVDF